MKRNITANFSVLIFLLAACSSITTRTEDSYPKDEQSSAESISPTIITEENSLAPIYRESDHCSVMAPADWEVQAGAYSGGLSAIDNGTKMGVQLGMLAVLPLPPAYIDINLAAPPANDIRMYSTDPHDVITATMEYELKSMGLPSNFIFTKDPATYIGEFTVEMATTSRGTYRVIWTTFPGDGLSYQYFLIIRIAAAPQEYWSQFGGQLTQIAMTQQCVAQNMNLSSYEVDTTKESNTSDQGYNPWLGSEWVTDDSTGQNYLVTTDDWSETGPDGPGYYKRNNNDLTKLRPGRS